MSPDPVRAWLATTLASLPEAITSLSVGAEFVDPNDRPNVEPRLRAAVGALQYPEDFGGGAPEIEAAMESVDALDDGLADMTAPFLFALPVDGWVTVTREELAPSLVPTIDSHLGLQHDPTPRRWITSYNAAPSFYGADPIPAADVRALADVGVLAQKLQPGETANLLLRRNADGILTLRRTG